MNMRTIRRRPFIGHKWDAGFWFRVFGWGIRGMDLRHNDMLFSERNGFGRYVYIGQWSFKFLSPIKMNK